MNLDTMVAAADPARLRDLAGPDSAEAARLYQQIVAVPPGRPGRARRGAAAGGRPPARVPILGRPAPAGWTRGRTVVIGLAAAAAALAVALLPSTPHQPGPGGQAVAHGTAAAVLDAAAVTAARGADAGQPPGHGQYLYVKEIVAKGLSNQPQRGCPEAPMTAQAWVAADGSGRQIGTFPARCARMDFDLAYRKGGMPWWLYGAVHANTLPTSPAALQRAIVRRFEQGHSRPSATFVYAATFLNSGSPPALRAALYRVIESLPGTVNLGPVRDALGRPGLGVGLVTSGSRAELIFDPVTTAVLEARTVAVGPPRSGNNMLPAGTVMQYTLYIREGVVGSTTATPVPSPSIPATTAPASTPATTAPASAMSLRSDEAGGSGWHMGSAAS